MSRLQKKPAAHKRGHPTLQNRNFFSFCGSFLPSWIRIRIRIPNTDPDPDPLARLNTDPIRIRIQIRIRNPGSLSPIFRIFHTRGLLSPPESEIGAGKLLDDKGHLQEELVGGHPNHCYIKAYCRCPRVDRVLQKNTHIADDHAKKLPEASVSLKWSVFKLCCPAHLFPNTPRR